MAKIVERFVLYRYVNREFLSLSKLFRTKAAAEKARLKYPEKERRAIGVGVVQLLKKALK